MLKHSPFSKSALNEASLPSPPAAAPAHRAPRKKGAGGGEWRPGEGAAGLGRAGNVGEISRTNPELTLSGTAASCSPEANPPVGVLNDVNFLCVGLFFFLKSQDKVDSLYRSKE